MRLRGFSWSCNSVMPRHASIKCVALIRARMDATSRKETTVFRTLLQGVCLGVELQQFYRPDLQLLTVATLPADAGQDHAAWKSVLDLTDSEVLEPRFAAVRPATRISLAMEKVRAWHRQTLSLPHKYPGVQTGGQTRQSDAVGDLAKVNASRLSRSEIPVIPLALRRSCPAGDSSGPMLRSTMACSCCSRRRGCWALTQSHPAVSSQRTWT